MNLGIKHLGLGSLPLLIGCALSPAAHHVPIPQSGDNAISGGARLIYNSGFIRDCTGEPVFLLPITPDSTARVMAVFGNPEGGYVVGHRTDELVPDNTSASEAECDDKGRFRFAAVPDGKYYVIARIRWLIRWQNNAVSLASPVGVARGETKEVDLKKLF